MPKRPAIFLDRDGVIVENRADYILSWSDVEFLPGAFAALHRLAASPFALVVVTNQSPVGRGLMPAETMGRINAEIVRQIERNRGRIDSVYACPHRPDEGCPCRKPQPGLLLQAAADLNLDLSRSVMIGDALTDVQAGLAAGCRPIMLLSGRGQAQLPKLRAGGYTNVPVLADLSEAVSWILEA